ncbi:ras-related protein Rab-13-like [Asterias amurensis]|uniref:ras-related protein Rab-13-like n=1 Tax=Asterias amurensis TaxID=7602 RepID=UPI003AB81971
MQYGDTRSLKFKVILLGESGVGKTSLFQRFRSRDIPSSAKSALMLDCYQHSRQFAVGPQGRKIQLELWDTANMERARSLTEQYYRETSASLLVYDIADSYSLRNIETYWQQELQNHASSSCAISFIVGNKHDLEVAKYDSEHSTVSYAKEVIGKQSKCKEVFEVSAREDYCVERMFHGVAEHLWKCHTQQSSKQKNTSGVASGMHRKESLSIRSADGGIHVAHQDVKTSGKGWGCC